MSPFKATPPQRVRVKAGQAIVFDLPEIESVPEPSVKWQTDDNSNLHGDAKFAMTSDNRLVILSNAFFIGTINKFA